MKILAKATSAKKPKTRESQNVAYIYAAILVILALTQLFTFDKFLVLLESFWLPGGKTVAYLLGSGIVVCEVLALPFLLRLKLSPLMRITCMVLGWMVPIIWLLLTIWLLSTINAISNIGFFGTTVELMPGWWAIFVCIAIAILAAWASWGLWPFEGSKKSKK